MTQFKNSYMLTNRDDKFPYFLDGSNKLDVAPFGGARPELDYYLSSHGGYDTNYKNYAKQSTEAEKERFIDKLLADLHLTAKSPSDPLRLAIYIHGLANIWSFAVGSTATFGTNLANSGHYQGLMVGYSWPSYDEDQSAAFYASGINFPPPAPNNDQYGTIRDNIIGSRLAFRTLMQLVVDLRGWVKSGTSPGGQTYPKTTLEVSILCHSEGNYMTMLGMDYLSANPIQGWTPIDHVLMLAADINHAALQNKKPNNPNLGWGVAIAELSKTVSVFSSPHDLALQASDVAFGRDGLNVHNTSFPTRLGLIGPFVWVYELTYGDLPENVKSIGAGNVVNIEYLRYLQNRGIVPKQVLVHDSYLYIPIVLQTLTEIMLGTWRAGEDEQLIIMAPAPQQLRAPGVAGARHEA